MTRITLLGCGGVPPSSNTIPTPTIDFNPAVEAYSDDGVTLCTDGLPVRKWVSGTYSAKQLTLSKRPVWRGDQFGTKPGVQFYLDDHLDIDGAGLTAIFNGTNTALSVFVVINYLSATSTQYFLAANNIAAANPQVRFGHYLGTNYVLWRNDDTSAQVSLAGSTVAFAPRVLSYVVTNSSPRADLWVWSSGQTATSGASATVSNASFTNGVVTTTDVTMGAMRISSSETGWMDGVIGRLLIYNSAVSSADRATIENYLISTYL